MPSDPRAHSSNQEALLLDQALDAVNQRLSFLSTAAGACAQPQQVRSGLVHTVGLGTRAWSSTLKWLQMHPDRSGRQTVSSKPGSWACAPTNSPIPIEKHAYTQAEDPCHEVGQEELGNKSIPECRRFGAGGLRLRGTAHARSGRRGRQTGSDEDRPGRRYRPGVAGSGQGRNRAGRQGAGIAAAFRSAAWDGAVRPDPGSSRRPGGDRGIRLRQRADPRGARRPGSPRPTSLPAFRSPCRALSRLRPENRRLRARPSRDKA